MSDLPTVAEIQDKTIEELTELLADVNYKITELNLQEKNAEAEEQVVKNIKKEIIYRKRLAALED